MVSCLASAGTLAVVVLLAADASAQPQFTEIRPLTNMEVRLQLSAPAGSGYRVDVATNPAAWSSLVTVTGATTSLVLTDTAAPYLPVRFYRAEQLSPSNLFTGDHLPTTSGLVVSNRYSNDGTNWSMWETCSVEKLVVGPWIRTEGCSRTVHG